MARAGSPALWLLLLAPGGALAATGAAEPAAGSAAADAASEPRPVEPSVVFDNLTVTGGAAEVESIPGSATFIGTEELSKQHYSDLHRILSLAPGINLQEEDGYGLRPNIGMRGTGVERSSKITLLEDGVLVAPAPYAAPAAYYVPTAGRMESLEIRKGSSAIAEGPYTNGGVINLVSRSIPHGFAASVNLALGGDETRRLDADVGRSGARFGWLLQTYQLDTDGFKQLDGGGPTGVDLEDYLVKARIGSRPGAGIYQAAELKLGATDQRGDETYLGLTREDFARTPFRRYAGSQQDYFDGEHEQAQLRYLVQPGSRFRATATAYRNRFFRNWHKGQSVAGVGLSAVVDSPELYPREIAILRGELDDLTGALKIRNNRRRYLSEGLELLAELDSRTGHADHSLSLGVRLHADEEDRFQEEDSWNMIGGFLRGEVRGAPGSQANQINSADATALFIRDEIRLGRWSLSPGVRLEEVEFAREDFGPADPTRSGAARGLRENRVRELLPGLGVSYRLDDRWAVFAGVHRGFAPPGPGQPAEVESERSLNYELGFNFRGANLGARAVAFFSDYENLLGRDTLSGGGEGTGDAFNGGEVDVRGLEATADYDLGRATGLAASVPVRVAYTWTTSVFRNGFETSFADWAPGVRAGDGLPYVPEHQLTATAGWVASRWASHLTLSYAAETRTAPGQGPIPAATALDERLVADLALDVRLSERLKLFTQVRNLGDETYLAARRPHGARPGLPRTVLVGIDWRIGR